MLHSHSLAIEQQSHYVNTALWPTVKLINYLQMQLLLHLVYLKAPHTLWTQVLQML